MDGIRGFAALTVVVFHAQSYAPLGESSGIWDGCLHPLIRYGWAGVDLFFVLSGFLITGILLRAREKPDYFRNFYIRRCLRIFPIYYVSLILVLGVLPLLTVYPGSAELPGNWPWYFLYLQNWAVGFGWIDVGGSEILGHFWSLAIEEQFYLVWPLLVWKLREKTLTKLSIAVIALAPILRLVLLLGGWGTFEVYSNTLARADGLLAGSLVAIALRNQVWRIRMERIAVPALWVGGIGLVLVYAWLGSVTFTNKKVLLLMLPLNLLLAAAVVFLGATRPASPPSRFFSARILRWFGKYSYALYIFHVPIMLVFDGMLGDSHLAHSPFVNYLLFLTVTGSASLAVALISWHWCEKYCLRLKDRYAPT